MKDVLIKMKASWDNTSTNKRVTFCVVVGAIAVMVLAHFFGHK